MIAASGYKEEYSFQILDPWSRISAGGHCCIRVQSKQCAFEVSETATIVVRMVGFQQALFGWVAGQLVSTYMTHMRGGALWSWYEREG